MRHPRDMIGHRAGDAFSALVLSGRYPDCRWLIEGRDVTRELEMGKYHECRVNAVEAARASERDRDDQITALLITLATR